MHIRILLRFLVELGKLILRKRGWPDDDLFLRTAYRVYLKREPDEDGRQYYLQALQRGHMSRKDVLRSLVRSNEFRSIYGLPVHPLNALHQARMMLVRYHLPLAEVIVDLGGASTGHPEGALLAMGYPHHPRKIYIVDLPPSQRSSDVTNAKLYESFLTVDGIQIHYLYQSMADPLPLESASVDLVWSGESIEHVTEAEADIVCQEVYRILKPGGCFCLDTPNASLTRLQSPEKLIHPEHKKEYYVHEFRSKLERWGFKIVEVKGICPMPESLRSGIFNYRELVANIRLSDNPEEGYLFFVKAVKPSPGGDLNESANGRRHS